MNGMNNPYMGAQMAPAAGQQAQGSPQDMQIIQAAIQAGASEEEIARLREQMGYNRQDAQAMQSPEGRMNGRIYTAANPMEHIAHALRKRRADSQFRGLQDEQKAAYGQLGQSRGDMSRGLYQRGMGGGTTGIGGNLSDRLRNYRAGMMRPRGQA